MLVRFAGAEDLNAPGLVGESGILFMEGEAEPAEVARLKRDAETIASDCEATGCWLTAAMEQAWQVAGALVESPSWPICRARGTGSSAPTRRRPR
jgi:hypothetical protein